MIVDSLVSLLSKMLVCWCDNGHLNLWPLTLAAYMCFDTSNHWVQRNVTWWLTSVLIGSRFKLPINWLGYIHVPRILQLWQVNLLNLTQIDKFEPRQPTTPNNCGTIPIHVNLLINVSFLQEWEPYCQFSGSKFCRTMCVLFWRNHLITSMNSTQHLDHVNSMNVLGQYKSYTIVHVVYRIFSPHWQVIG